MHELFFALFSYRRLRDQWRRVRLQYRQVARTLSFPCTNKTIRCLWNDLVTPNLSNTNHLYVCKVWQLLFIFVKLLSFFSRPIYKWKMLLTISISNSSAKDHRCLFQNAKVGIFRRRFKYLNTPCGGKIGIELLMSPYRLSKHPISSF